MRLLVRSKLWRAFPELDRFSDEQCARFVEAANRAWAGRLLRGTVILASFVLLLAAMVGITAAVVSWIGDSWYLRRGRTMQELLPVLGIVVNFFVPLVGAYLVRDWLLRRSVRRVISMRGACAGCGYSLLGLPVPPSLKITCPECGAPTEVDPALGELAPDSSGQPVFAPSDSIKAPPRWLTPRRLKRIAWWSGGLIGGSALFGAVGWFGWDWWLHRQARQAMAEMPTVSMAVEASEGGLTPGGENKWRYFDRAATLAADAVTNVRSGANAPQYADGAAALIEYSMIGASEVNPDGSPLDEDRLARQRVEKAAALRAMAEFERLGGPAVLRQMCEATMGGRDYGAAATEPAADVNLSHLGDARRLTRVCRARMTLAREAGDWKEFLESLEAGLTLGRMSERQPGLISRLVAIAIDAAIFAEVRVALRSDRMDARTLEQIAGIIAADEARRTPLAACLESERLLMLSGACTVYGDPRRVRNAVLRGLVGMRANDHLLGEGRVGTYVEVREALKAWPAEIVAQSALLPAKRRRSAATDLGFIRANDVAANALRSIDMHAMNLGSTRVMVALERHRALHGEYPLKLDELAPSFLPAVPLDPWSGKALLYKRVDARADPEGRGYLLYGVGWDGVDGGGVEDTYGFETMVKGQAAGKDFITNTKKRD